MSYSRLTQYGTLSCSNYIRWSTNLSSTFFSKNDNVCEVGNIYHVWIVDSSQLMANVNTPDSLTGLSTAVTTYLSKSSTFFWKCFQKRLFIYIYKYLPCLDSSQLQLTGLPRCLVQDQTSHLSTSANPPFTVHNFPTSINQFSTKGTSTHIICVNTETIKDVLKLIKTQM